MSLFQKKKDRATSISSKITRNTSHFLRYRHRRNDAPLKTPSKNKRTYGCCCCCCFDWALPSFSTLCICLLLLSSMVSLLTVWSLFQSSRTTIFELGGGWYRETNHLRNDSDLTTTDAFGTLSSSFSSAFTTASSASSTSSTSSTPKMKERPAIVLLAGPHKTGTSSIQTNLWKWSTPYPPTDDTKSTTVTNTNNNNTASPPLSNWVWAVPPLITQHESSDPRPWPWTPSKGFYPLLEALRHPKRPLPKNRSLFRKLSTHQIVQEYVSFLTAVRYEGYGILLGTEAVDNLVKDDDGDRILDDLALRVLSPVAEVVPYHHHHDHLETTTTAITTHHHHHHHHQQHQIHHTTEGRITIVIVYRTPKSKHLISVWHQNALKRTSPNFHQWITTTANDLGALDALGMVDLVLHANSTQTWEVVLIDGSGVRNDGLDLSDVVRCEVLGEECGYTIGDVGEEKEERRGGDGGRKDDPVFLNVRKDQRAPDVSNQVLERMEKVLRGYDCRYRSLFDGIIDHNGTNNTNTNNTNSNNNNNNDRYKGRFRVLYPHELTKIMEDCRNGVDAPYPVSRKEMKDQIVKIALEGGKIQANVLET